MSYLQEDPVSLLYRLRCTSQRKEEMTTTREENVCIDLSTQDERHGDKNVVGKLLKAMCGTRDVPHPRRRP